MIGAGVLGASTAHYLAEAGARVTVLEAAEVARGASAASFAVDITRVKTPRALFELSLASAEEHARLQASHADSAWLHQVPTLEWERDLVDRQRLRDRVERLHNRGYPARWLSVTKAREIEPALDPGMPETWRSPSSRPGPGTSRPFSPVLCWTAPYDVARCCCWVTR